MKNEARDGPTPAKGKSYDYQVECVEVDAQWVAGQRPRLFSRHTTLAGAIRNLIRATCKTKRPGTKFLARIVAHGSPAGWMQRPPGQSRRVGQELQLARVPPEVELILPETGEVDEVEEEAAATDEAAAEADVEAP